MKKGKVNVGPIGFEWEKELQNRDADINIVKTQIDSYLLVIEHKSESNLLELCQPLKKLINVIEIYGHLIRLEKEYQDKFFKLTKFRKDNCHDGGVVDLISFGRGRYQ